MVAKHADFVLPGLSTPSARENLLNAWILAYGRRFNPRRLECAFYAPWTLILLALIKDKRDVHVTPQYLLYTIPPRKTRNAPQSISAATVAEPDAVDIIPDFVITYIHVVQQRPGVLIAPGTKPWDKYQIKKLFVPIIVEAKRPPPRSLESDQLDTFKSELHKTMVKAHKQAVIQAQIMFHSKTYPQQAVILLACVGEWWSWRIYTKAEAKNQQEHLFRKEVLDELVEYRIHGQDKDIEAADPLNLRDPRRFEAADQARPTRHPDVDGWPAVETWSKSIFFGSEFSSQKLYLVNKWLGGFMENPDKFIQPPKKAPKEEPSEEDASSST